VTRLESRATEAAGEAGAVAEAEAVVEAEAEAAAWADRQNTGIS
jgi:hypothetical protein